jgi:CspA family cold shock protein
VHGNIKWWNEDKGFGFVTADDGQDVFVHFSEVAEGLRLEDDMRVEFDVKPGAKGPQATHVRAVVADSDADGARSSAPRPPQSAPRPSPSWSAGSVTEQERKSAARENREWRLKGWS